MADLVMPKVEVVATAPNFGRFAIAPIEKGFGLILGNALRRILLSSLPGAAITNVRIEGVYHEFSTIPHVKEDVTEIILNIKKIRLQSFSERPVRLQLSARGPGPVRASDIQLPSTIELINGDQVIATLDSAEGRLEMEFTVERGRGWSSSDAREGVTIGTIPVDAIYTPIPQVNYISQPFEDESGLHERLLLEVWTDGTIDAGEALSLASSALAQHSNLIATYSSPSANAADRPGVAPSAIPPQVAEMPIEDLQLSVRTLNCLKRSGITRVGQILTMTRKELLGVRNFGMKSYDELRDALSSRGLPVPGGPADDEEEETAEGAEAEFNEDELYEMPSDFSSFIASPDEDEES